MQLSNTESVASFVAMLQQSAALLNPPPVLTVSEWADTYGRLSSASSAEPGQWYTSRAEYQRQPMDCITDPTVETIVLMWASQVGKTAIALMAFGYHSHHDPAPILFVEPTLEIAEAVSKDRIAAMIRDTPALQGLFGDPRSRDSGNTLLHKQFPGGHLTMAGANSAASLASRPIRILITDEEGVYDQTRDGNSVKVAKRRTATFWNRKHLRISSPRLRKTCSITKAYQRSDQRRYYVPCPQCGHFQVLKFGDAQTRYGLKWPGPDSGHEQHDPSKCYYVCEENGCLIEESDKPEMVSRGEWRAEMPGNGDGKTVGFHLNALYSTLGFTWADIVSGFLEAKETPSELQVFVNTVLAEPWDEQAEGAEYNQISKRVEPYAAPAPAWVVVITAGVDVQKDRIEATKWGWGVNEVSGVIEHKIFRGDPAQKAIWDEVKEWLRQKTRHESGIELRTACTLVDSGDGNRTQAVYRFCRALEMERIYACKGSSLAGSPLVNAGRRLGRYKTLVVMVGTSTAKDDFFAKLKVEDRAEPGYVHFPMEAKSWPDYFAQLTAEVLVTKHTKSGDKLVWERRGRNETLDCAVYAMAAREFLKPNLKVIAKRMKEQAEVVAAATEAAQANPEGKIEAKPPVSNNQKKRKKTRRMPGSSWIHG